MLHHGVEKLKALLPAVDEFLPISEVGFNNPQVRKDKHHAWVTISTGCNSFCTFCIVPKSRGRESSRPYADIMKEVRGLAREGYTEITLLGQNVNSWGLEKIGMSLRKRLDEDRQIPAPQTQYLPVKGTPPFVKLLKAVCETKGIEKVHFLTSNPWDFHQELIDYIATQPKIDRTIHLPVQSGDNEVLRRMNRGYTREQYLELVKRLRDQVPEVEFGTDIIVGFPGETEEQFQNTVDLCKKVDFKVAYIARYSPRPGTVSDKIYEDNIHDLEKKRRWLELDKVANKIHHREA
jgi:tRNA-2-methylthio-N6-dimethylallyladenosine synthase